MQGNRYPSALRKALPPLTVARPIARVKFQHNLLQDVTNLVRRKEITL